MSKSSQREAMRLRKFKNDVMSGRVGKMFTEEHLSTSTAVGIRAAMLAGAVVVVSCDQSNNKATFSLIPKP